MSKVNVFFIINPIAGGKKKQTIPALVDTYLDKSKFNAEYHFTTHVGHAAFLAEEAALKNFEIIIAVGGDGTINEIAGKVMQQHQILGIIPLGSGNGLARSLKIPLSIKKAIEIINDFRVAKIDAATFNDHYFFNMAGMGFDAQLSAAFAGNKIRGLKGYLTLGIKEMINYKPQQYRLIIDGKDYSRRAFAISIANSSQYGNNIYISPQSDLKDGLLEVCIIKPFSFFKLLLLSYEMIRAKTHRSSIVEIISGKIIKIVREKDGYVHLDGEAFFKEREININVLPGALKVILPKSRQFTSTTHLTNSHE